eukprot:CCRYP_001310-RA/>CCRYP_001310-RA protein AED:0.58 eAED:0.44 QI:0/0/0/0.66/0.5/0.33/3/0/180
MLVALGSLAMEQANPTTKTMERCLQFLDYAASQEDVVVTYRSSDMILGIHSDAPYLSEPKARSHPTNNGAVHTVAKIIKSVMSSAAEAELGGLFINAKSAVPIRTTLEELGHKQPPTPIQTDNSTACEVVNNEIKSASFDDTCGDFSPALYFDHCYSPGVNKKYLTEANTKNNYVKRYYL